MNMMPQAGRSLEGAFSYSILKIMASLGVRSESFNKTSEIPG